MQLFESIVPKTAENFKRMLLGSAVYNNKLLSLLGSTFHQVFTNGFASSGRLKHGPMSIYGPIFRDESFEILHTKPGLLSSVSKGNTNSSEWVLTLAPCPYLDHRNVVLG
jgi:peptidylprolyl isomerase